MGDDEPPDDGKGQLTKFQFPQAFRIGKCSHAGNHDPSCTDPNKPEVKLESVRLVSGEKGLYNCVLCEKSGTCYAIRPAGDNGDGFIITEDEPEPGGCKGYEGLVSRRGIVEILRSHLLQIPEGATEDDVKNLIHRLDPNLHT